MIGGMTGCFASKAWHQHVNAESDKNPITIEDVTGKTIGTLVALQTGNPMAGAVAAKIVTAAIKELKR